MPVPFAIAATSSSGLFGDGRDGDLVVNSGQTAVISTIRTPITASGASAAPADSSGFNVGDVVLFYQSQATVNVGRWEFNQITTINSPNSWTLAHGLTYDYDSTNGKAQVIKVSQYRNVTVQSGGTLTAPVWDGNTGGILVFDVDGTLTVQSSGMIIMNNSGYRGAPINSSGYGGSQGEGEYGLGIQSTTANGVGGGGGCSNGYGNPPGGGGGGYGTSGTAGNPGNNSNCDIPGAGGGTIGGPDLSSQLFFGGGGGSGGAKNPSNGNYSGGYGGAGGGIIIINANTATVDGAVSTNGQGGGLGAGFNTSANGGGGAGGSLLLTVGNGTASTVLSALGGPGGIYSGNSTEDGGPGGLGRVEIQYCTAFSGSTSPSANVQPVNCPPGVAADNTSVTVNEGQVATNTGTYSDANSSDNVTISASIGTVMKTGTDSGTWNWSFPATDGPSQSQTVTITADDGNGGVSTTTFSLSVNNEPPTVNTPGISPEPSLVGNSATVSASFSDPGANDAPFTCTVNYGDGSGNLMSTVSGNTCTGPTHIYTSVGNYTVSVSVTDKDGGTGSATTTHTVSPKADLAVTIIDSPDPVRMKKDLTYTITVTNNGPSTATNVALSDTLPGSVTLVSVKSSQGSCSGTGTPTCTLGSLANGSSATITIIVIPKQAGTISNTATVAANEADPNNANNSTTAITTVKK